MASEPLDLSRDPDSRRIYESYTEGKSSWIGGEINDHDSQRKIAKSRQSLDLGKVAQGLSPSMQKRILGRVIGISESSRFEGQENRDLVGHKILRKDPSR